MKYLIILALAAGGYFYFSNQQDSIPEVKSWHTLVNNVENEGVYSTQVRQGVYILAQRFCNDASFQNSGGSSISSCKKSLNNLGQMCEDRIFKNAPSKYNSKSEVASLGKRFASCVGAI